MPWANLVQLFCNRVSTLTLPPGNVDDNTASNEPTRVARCDSSPSDERGSGNQFVKRIDRDTGASACYYQRRVLGSAAEWQYAPGQIFVEDCLGSGCQSLLPPPFRQCGNAIQHLGTVDGGGVKQGSGLGGDPSEHYWVRLAPYQFGQNIGVDNDQGFKRGGSDRHRRVWLQFDISELCEPTANGPSQVHFRRLSSIKPVAQDAATWPPWNGHAETPF